MCGYLAGHTEVEPRPDSRFPPWGWSIFTVGEEHVDRKGTLAIWTFYSNISNLDVLNDDG